MIASETWWKMARAVNRAGRLPVALAPLLFAGCANTPPPTDPASLLPSPAPAPAAALKARKQTLLATTGLRPLATPQQVLSSVPLGRRDPFGRLIPAQPPGVRTGMPAARAGKPSPVPPSPLQLPQDFSINGVISSGGVSEAVVSFGDLSGSLRPGDRGGRTTELLPPGWSVAAIDVQRGVLTLKKGDRKVSAEL